MAREILLVLTNPNLSTDAEYNDWYDREHIPGVLGRGTIERATRYRLGAAQRNPDPPPYRYATVYELGPGGARADTQAALLNPLPVPPHLIERSQIFSYYFTPID